MAKNKNKSTAIRPPSELAKARQEPTKEQIARLNTAEARIGAMSAEYGQPTIEGSSEQISATLEESLKRVEGMLNNAKGLFEKARGHEIAAAEELKRLKTQARDQEESLRQRRKDIEAELTNQRNKLEKRELEVEQREEKVQAKETEQLTREADLSELAARLTERELNAERGFLAEKARVLRPIEEEVDRLRKERDGLKVDIAERSCEAHLAFDAEMSAKKQEMLSNLHLQLRKERERGEAEWQEKISERQKEVEEREQILSDQERRLRGEQQKLLAEQEILADDKGALTRKIERMVAEKTEDLRHEKDALNSQLTDARATRDTYFKELESRRELDRRLGGRTPEEILADLNVLERERDTLAQQLRERPNVRVAEQLAELERERSAWLEERAVLQGDLAKAHGELATRRLAAIELEALKKQKEALEVHKQLLDGAVNELRSRVDELTRQEDHRNPMTALASMDEKEELQAEARTTTPFGRTMPTLREFADDLRHRIATGVEGRTLYYAERDVRAFLGGLAMTRLMLLQGISGTGKTSLPLAFASAVGGGIEIVEVQAGWRDRQDLIGYYNAFHRHYYATNFLQALYKAGTPAYRDRLFMMVLDEINLSRPEQFFADFLSALEQPMEARRLTLVNDPVNSAPRLMVDNEGRCGTGNERHLPIPPNVWFVGTANHDESTAEFADKTYDRAHVMEMPRKSEAAHFAVDQRGQRNPISYEKLNAAFTEAANKQSKAVESATSWLRKAPFASSLGQRFRVGWGNRLEHQLARYLPVVVETGGTVGEAMDHLLVTKVLRKLKDRHDVRAAALEELHDQILGAWDKLDKTNPPERCVALIENEIAAKKGEDLV